MPVSAIALALLSAAAAQTSPTEPNLAVVPETTLPTIEVVGTSPLPGVGIDRDKVPSNVQSLPAPDTTKRGPAALINELD